MIQKNLLAILTILSIAALHITQIFTLAPFFPTILALGLVLLIAIFLKATSQLPCLILMFLTSLLGILPKFLMSSIFPVAISLMIVAIFPSMRPSLTWLRRGKIDRTSWLLAAITVPISVLALLLWAQWSDFLGGGVENVKQIANLPKWMLFGLAIPFFALINAAAEELFYRGFIQEALLKTMSSFKAINALQALAFAAAHFYHGFPNGLLGFIMTFLWALVLGYLRQRTQGLLLSFLIHVVADAIIATVLISIVH